MEYGEIVRSTRQAMGKNVRDFALLLDRASASGCSSSLVGHWETGQRRPVYERFDYIYRHTDDPQVREMAGAILNKLDPDRAADDLKRYCNAVVP